MGKRARQHPKGKKRPRGYGQDTPTADDILKRLRADPPPRPRRRRRSVR